MSKKHINNIPNSCADSLLFAAECKDLLVYVYMSYITPLVIKGSWGTTRHSHASNEY